MQGITLDTFYPGGVRKIGNTAHSVRYRRARASDRSRLTRRSNNSTRPRGPRNPRAPMHSVYRRSILEFSRSRGAGPTGVPRAKTASVPRREIAQNVPLCATFCRARNLIPRGRGTPDVIAAAQDRAAPPGPLPIKEPAGTARPIVPPRPGAVLGPGDPIFRTSDPTGTDVANAISVLQRTPFMNRPGIVGKADLWPTSPRTQTTL
jgi:hypothetical protein